MDFKVEIFFLLVPSVQLIFFVFENNKKKFEQYNNTIFSIFFNRFIGKDITSLSSFVGTYFQSIFGNFILFTLELCRGSSKVSSIFSFRVTYTRFLPLKTETKFQ